jgi:dienelactone hydrolase
MSLDGFTEETFDHEGISHPVYRTGTGPGVILMHELPGMSPECVDLGRQIAAAGFTVYLPLFFGQPNHRIDFPLRILARSEYLRLCVRREWKLLAKGESSPVVDWLRALARRVHGECGGPGVGAIGMCLTGDFGIAMLLESPVLAPVVCQPSLPFCFFPYPRNPETKASIGGLGPEERACAKERVASEGLKILGLRFTHDAISPRERFQTLRDEYGEGFLGTEIPSGPGNPHGLPKGAHSTLTGNYGADGESLHPVQQEARETVIEFLRERLAAVG